MFEKPETMKLRMMLLLSPDVSSVLHSTVLVMRWWWLEICYFGSSSPSVATPVCWQSDSERSVQWWFHNFISRGQDYYGLKPGSHAARSLLWSTHKSLFLSLQGPGTVWTFDPECGCLHLMKTPLRCRHQAVGQVRCIPSASDSF